MVLCPALGPFACGRVWCVRQRWVTCEGEREGERERERETHTQPRADLDECPLFATHAPEGDALGPEGREQRAVDVVEVAHVHELLHLHEQLLEPCEQRAQVAQQRAQARLVAPPQQLVASEHSKDQRRRGRVHGARQEVEVHFRQHRSHARAQ